MVTLRILAEKEQLAACVHETLRFSTASIGDNLPTFFNAIADDDSSDIENIFKRTMPWLGDEICIKDPQTQNVVLPGLSLMQWMNMQQNPVLANSTMQPDYLRSMTGPVLQNLTATDLSRQLGMQAHILQQNNLQFSSPRSSQQSQQVEQLPKLPDTLNQLGSVNRLQQQMDGINQQQRQHFVNQALPQNQTQTQLSEPQILSQNFVQQQQQPPLIQNQQPQANIFPNQQPLLQQQQPQSNLGLNQQQNRTPVQLSHQANQQLQLSEHQIKLQLLQKLQQQQQSVLSQSALQQPQLNQLQEQQRFLMGTQQQLSNPNLLSQQHVIQPQMAKNSQDDIRSSQPMQPQPQQKVQKQSVVLPELPGSVLPPPPATNLFSTPSSCLLPNGAQSGITDDIPSCSTSPSTNNCPVLPQSILNRTQRGTFIMEDVSRSAATVLSPGTLEAMTTSPNLSKDLQKPDIHMKPSMPIPKTQGLGVAPQTYLSAPQMDCLDTSSSGTSVCISQTDGPLQQNFPLSAFNPQAMFRDTAQDGEGPVDLRNNVLFGVNIEGPLGIPLTPDPSVAKSMGSGRDFQNHLSTENVLTNYGSSKEVQQELSSSIVSQSFGATDMAFNPGVQIDSNISDGSFLNGGPWAHPPQLQRMRTFTKVRCFS